MMTAEQQAAYDKCAKELADMKPTDPAYAKKEEYLARLLQAPWVAGNAHDKKEE